MIDQTQPLPQEPAEPCDYWTTQGAPLLPDLTVSDHEAITSEILDADGRPLSRRPAPIGFIHY